MGNLTRSSGVGAFENQSAVTTTPNVHHDIPYVSTLSGRSVQVLVSDRAAPVTAPLGYPYIPLASSSVDHLRVPGSSALDSASSILSLTSLLFPLPVSGISSFPGPSSSSSSLFSASGSSLGCTPAFFLFSSFLFSSSSSFFYSFVPVFGFFSLFLFGYVRSSSYCLFSSFLILFSSFFSFCLLCFSYVSLSCFLFISSSFCASSSWFSSFLLLCLFPSSSFSFLFFSFFFGPSSSFSVPPVPPPSSSSSSFSGSLSSSALADYQARLLGLSPDYQSLARFVGSGGTDFAGVYALFLFIFNA